MKKFITGAAVAAAALSMSIGAAGMAMAADQVLRVSVAGSPADLNPLTSTTATAHDLQGNILETLVRQGKDGTIEQGSGLAESWTLSDDQLVYTFTLKDGIVWSDGTPITADQFVYCMQEALAPETASEYAYMLYPVQNAEEYNTGAVTDPNEVGVKALDDKTLEITLKEPTPYFIGTLVIPQYGALPVGIVEEMGDDFFMDAEHMLSNGPFVCTEFNPDMNMVMEKNENYWDAENVKLDRIEIDFVMETNTIVNLYETGQIDVMQVEPEFTANYENAAGYISVQEPVTEYLRFNFNNEYFANENIRRAFSLALNRDVYINNLMRNGCTPAYAFIPGGMAGQTGSTFREDVGDLYYDSGNNEGAAAEAVELLNKGLEELGKTFDEFNASGLTLILGEGDANMKTAQIFQETWKQVLGVDVTPKNEAYDLRHADYDSGDWTLSKEGWGADYDDPMSFLELFETKSTYNDTGYSSEEYDALITKARSLGASDERIIALEDAERLLVGEDFVIAPTFFQTRHWVNKDNVHDIVRHGIGLYVDYKYAYIE